MPSKPSQPALYEKMRARAVPQPPISPKVDIPPPQTDVVPSAPKWLAPGTAIRLPVGYILLAAGAVLLVVVIVYMFGVRQGKTIARAGIEEQIISSTPTAGVSDPLSNLQPVVDPTSGRPAGAGNALSAGARGQAGSSAGTWGPVAPKTDPRRKGLNYFILAETSESGAIQLAEFCRSQGLETYVVSGKNDRLRRVVAFPGFDLSVTSRTGPQVQKQHQKILQVGELWARSGSGRKNLNDTYLLKYD